MKRIFAAAALTAAVLVASTSAQEAQPTPSTSPARAASPPASPAAATATAAATPSAPAAGMPGAQCVQANYKEVREELWSGRRPVKQIESATYFLPAGAEAEIAVNEPFRDGATYFAYMERISDGE